MINISCTAHDRTWYAKPNGSPDDIVDCCKDWTDVTFYEPPNANSNGGATFLLCNQWLDSGAYDCNGNNLDEICPGLLATTTCNKVLNKTPDYQTYYTCMVGAFLIIAGLGLIGNGKWHHKEGHACSNKY